MTRKTFWEHFRDAMAFQITPLPQREDEPMNLPNPYKDDRGRVAGAYKMESLAWELFEQGRTLECSNILRTLDHFSVEAWLNLLYIAVKNEVGGQP